MPLSDKQVTALQKAAQDANVDPAELVKAAGKVATDGTAPKKPEQGGGKQAAAELRPLYQYHLPFVTVREVREIWLGLTERIEGDETIAAVFAAKVLGGAAPEPPKAAPLVAATGKEQQSNG